jgi:hypothetical protein
LKNGVDATDRISDIDAGVDLADIEVIPKMSAPLELMIPTDTLSNSIGK